MPSQSDITNQILSALSVTVPDLDTSIGTVVRKTVDATSEAIAEAYVDQFFLGYQYDIDTLSGSALDDFVQLFGFTRFGARRAVGVVTFARPNQSPQAISIPTNMGIATGDSPQVVFTTLIPAVMPAGGVSIDVPVIASLGGSAGNVPANAISQFIQSISGFTSLANTSPTSGGVDAEADDVLRARFKNTVFRNFAGTEQMFLGVAQENPSVSRANVIGAAKTHREQIQVTGHTAQSTVQNAKYIYPYNFVFGPNIDAGDILNPGIHYTLNGTTNPLSAPAAPAIAVLTGTTATFAASTPRFYRIAWANGAGLTPASTEITATTSAVDQYFKLTIPVAPPGVPYAYVYGSGTTNTEGLLAIVPVSQATTTIWNDTNIYTASTAYPTTNTTGYAPTITSLDYSNCPDGIYDLQFDYVPIASRNDPVNGVTNKIDVYIQGDDEQQANETIGFSTSSTFNTTPGDPLNITNYQHPDGTQPKAGNYFMKLTFAPVSQLPTQITLSAQGGIAVTGQTVTVGNTVYSTDTGIGNEVGSVVYNLGIDYFQVNNTTNLGGSPHSVSGIEWATIANGGSLPAPPTNSLLQINYNYNAAPREVETALQKWRLVTTDTWVHQAKQILLSMNLVVILAPGFSQTGVQGPITAAIQGLLGNTGFDSVVSASEVLTAVGQVSGIQAVRFTTLTDANAISSTAYAIQQFTSTQSIIQTFSNGGRVIDVYLADDTVPVLDQVNLTIRAQNTFGNGA